MLFLLNKLKVKQLICCKNVTEAEKEGETRCDKS